MSELAYRYADVDTFLKMLETQTLWFSDLRKMNDWDEYAAGFRIANEIIVNEFPDHKDLLDEISPEQMSPAFMMLTCSLTKDGDCLSMWRGYGGNGSGASIGYDHRAIENHHLFERYLAKREPINGRVKFFSVIYEEEPFKEMIRSHIRQSLKLSSGLSAESSHEFKTVRFRMLRLALPRLFTLYKNEFFMDEREIRDFIEINDKIDCYELKTRDGDFGKTVYHEVNTNFQGLPAIKEVVLGPRCSISPELVREKLIECGLPDVSIRQSRGTYRA